MRPARASLPGLALVAALLLAPSARLAAQARPDLRIRAQDAEWTVPLQTSQGYAALPAAELSRIGWTVTAGTRTASLDGPQGVRIELFAGSPYFRWTGHTLQLAHPPYVESGIFLVPAQLVTDFMPRRLPDVFTYDGATMALGYAGPSGERPRATAADTSPATPPVTQAPAPTQPEAAAPPPVAAPPTVAAPSAPDSVATRVVIIDAGHGGKDPGSISRAGLKEKTVALGVAQALARDLDTIPGLEVHLLRDDDTFIPLWDRGAIATKIKGERPGVFISIHANSFNSPARGFETYFLSDARTEHERRVAAIENAPLGAEEENVKPGGDLDFILRDMKNLDTQHWSALLAELVQDEVDPVHPGPNRGVKQAPLAVITNALMPGVLFEVGYLSHPEEARLLGRPDFQARLGQAVARAVVRFFDRYPPGTGGLPGSGR